MMAVITEIYEAAMLPEYWPATLRNIIEHVGAAGCNLITIDTVSRSVASAGFEKETQLYMESEWPAKNEPLNRLLKLAPHGFVREIDIFTTEEVENLAIVRDYKRPYGLGWSAAMATPMPSGEMLLCSVEQFWDRGPLSDTAMAELERLRPHLSRAALLAAKLQHRRAEAAVHDLGLVGVAAAIVTLRGTVLAANDPFQSHGDRLVISARNRLRIVSPQAAALIETALARIATDAADAPPMSIAVPANKEHAPLVLHVLPVAGRARDIFGTATCLLVATSVAAGTAPSASLLRALFDLTPAESRVAEAIVSGREKAASLKGLGMAPETERTHVKSIFRKTGLNSRIDLVRLLGSLGGPA